MLRKRFIFVAVLLALSAGAAIASRVQVVEQWALYTSSDAKQPLRLFLEPFPAETFCKDDAVAIVRDGGHAECRKRLSFTLDRGPADRLFWEFVTEWVEIRGPRRVAAR